MRCLAYFLSMTATFAMRRTVAFAILAFCACCFGSTPMASALAAKTAVVPGEDGRYPLGPYLFYLEDPAGSLTIDDVSSARFEAKFVPCELQVPVIGLTDSAYWVRVRLRNRGAEAAHWFLVLEPADLDFVDCWLPDEAGRFHAKFAGDRRPFSAREIDHRLSAFLLDLPTGSERTLYLRFKTKGVLLFDPVLWRADAFYARTSRDNLFYGAFLGALCIMGAYNLFLFGALGERAHLHYVLFLFFLAMQLSTFNYGFSFQYLWPGQPAFNQMAPFIFVSLMMFFASNFAVSFLRTDMYAPRLHRSLYGLRVAFLLTAALSITSQDRWLIACLAVASMAAILMIMSAGIQAWRKGFRPAGYYIAAWGLLWLNGLVFGAHMLSLASIPDHARFAPFVVTAMVLFLSLALADRINLLKEQAEAAKAETEELNRRLEEHQEILADRAKSVLFANMSHELRTPLNSILGFAKVLSRSPNISSEDRAHLERIARNGEQLLALVNQVLDLSNIEAGRMVADNNDIDLWRLIEETVDVFCARASRKGLRFEVATDDELPRYVRADEAKLRQALANLLDNAVKFTDEGAVSLRISIVENGNTGQRASQKGPSDPAKLADDLLVLFEITDTGPGIAEESLGRVFEAFGRDAAERRPREGAGLGLQVARRFARLMGGDLLVESRVGRGTRATLRVRVEKVDAKAIHPRCPACRGAGREMEGAGGRGLFAQGKDRKVPEKECRTQAALQALPEEWLEGLQKGAHRADIMLINKVVEQIGERDRALANNLAKLAEDFEYDELLALIRKDQIGEDG